jgi:hypothetical protein
MENLIKSMTITKEMYHNIIKNKYEFTEKETQEIAKELFQRLEQNSQIAFKKEKKEKRVIEEGKKE